MPDDLDQKDELEMSSNFTGLNSLFRVSVTTEWLQIKWPENKEWTEPLEMRERVSEYKGAQHDA